MGHLADGTAAQAAYTAGVSALFVICNVSVPLFFFISGFLFFTEAGAWTWGTWRSKLKRRVYTLLVPYLAYNAISAANGYLMQALDPTFTVAWDNPGAWPFIGEFWNSTTACAGMTNILRTFGKTAAALTLTGDMLKGALAVGFAKMFMAHYWTVEIPRELSYNFLYECAVYIAVFGALRKIALHHLLDGGDAVFARSFEYAVLVDIRARRLYLDRVVGYSVELNAHHTIKVVIGHCGHSGRIADQRIGCGAQVRHGDVVAVLSRAAPA